MRVNKHSYQVTDANCGDPFTIADDHWSNSTTNEGPYNKVPSRLIQDYYEVCVPFTQSLLLSLSQASYALASTLLSYALSIFLIFSLCF